jgi:flagellar motor switch/type III secretory pathway protein FliN
MITPCNVEHVLDVPVPFEGALPGPVMRVGDLLALVEGSLIQTARSAGETVEVFAGGSLIGFAELAEANGRRAVRMVRFEGSR